MLERFLDEGEIGTRCYGDMGVYYREGRIAKCDFLVLN